MKFNEIKEKNKEADNKKQQIIQFFQKNARYIVGAVVLIALMIVLIKCAGNSTVGNEDGTEIVEIEGADGDYEVDANEEINTLITNYYNAYANGDVDTIAALATPLSEEEKSNIAMYSQYVEAYQCIKCYTKQGLDSESYLVSVYLEVKFVGVDTVAPGLSFFYVQTNDDGSLYINNVYSLYNMSALVNGMENAYPMDSNIKLLIDKFVAQEDVAALLADVQTKYEAAIASDPNLAALLNTTLADAYNTWAATIETEQPADAATEQPADAATEQPADAATEQPADAAAEQPAPEQPAAVEQTNDTVYALDTVNIRAEANETANILGTATIGASFTRTGTTADGWSQVDYNGVTAFIKSDYLTTDASQTSQSTANSVAAGETVRLSDTVNIRSSMSETADRLGVAYAGENVTVLESYAEGWSKVDWNGKTGYIKTDLLQ